LEGPYSIISCIMLTIQLKDLVFRSRHGVYPEEKLLGGDFCVNLTVDFDPGTVLVESLDQTLNYERLFEMVKRRMDIPTPLLETICMELAAEILSEFSMVSRVNIVLEKKNPPIPSLLGSVVVSYTAIRP
jgi:7,8-dihydroneopterin aldolase/epimerase/oxygenase